MTKQITSVISLFSICAVIAIVLALTNIPTAPKIQKNEEEKVKEAINQILPDGENGASFKEEDLSEYSNLPDTVKEVFYSEKLDGYVFKLETKGYKPKMVVMCGITADATVSKAIYISGGETIEDGKKYGDLFSDKAKQDVDSEPLVSGATKTTKAYKSAINDAFTAFEIINTKGGN